MKDAKITAVNRRMMTYKNCYLCVCVCVWLVSLLAFGASLPVEAATMPVSSIASGKIVAVNGQKFVKIGTDLQKGSRLMALEKVMFLPPNTQVTTDCPRSRIIGTMQTWNDCANLATPASTGYTDIGCLVDERDGKTYEIRKFADGKCWMVENLMYGGASDNCAGVDAAGYTDATYGGANGMATPSNRFGAGTYGNCRDPRVDAAAASPCYNSTACGYYYNWQAVMQLSSAYFGVNVTYPNGTPSTDTNFHQGICPTGWHVPAGSITGEFYALGLANGFQDNFWPGDIFKGVYSGLCYSSGALAGQGFYGYYWTSMQSNAYYVHSSNFDSSYMYWGDYDKNYGFAVRCIKD